MKDQIKVSKFHITAPGDASVGIFPSMWTIEPEMYFEDEEELNTFRADLQSLFENYSGEKVFVQTEEELIEEEKHLQVIAEQSEELLNEMNDSEFIDIILNRNDDMD